MSSFKLLMTLLITLFISASAYGTKYYVNTAIGNDSSSGTSSSTPFKTINKGISVLSAGDTVYVHRGTYIEDINTSVHGASWSNHVAILAFPGDTPVIRPNTSSANGVVHFRNPSGDTARYVLFSGFVIDADSVNQSGVAFSEGAHHIRLINCEIKNVSAVNSAGIKVFSTAGTGIELSKLIVHNTASQEGIRILARDVVVSESEIYNCYIGILPQNTSNVSLLKNKVHHNTRQGIHLISDSGDLVSNNIIWKNGLEGINLAADVDVRVYNNTSTLNGNDGIYLSNTSGVNQVKNNIGAFNAGYNIRDNFNTNTLVNNFSSGDPLFVDTAKADFRLQNSSLCIDSGATLSVVLDDIRGAQRPQRNAYDLGAYEGRIYYVAKHGNDSNPGTDSLSFLTIAKGIVTISDGDMLVVDSGTYHEKVFVTKSNVVLKCKNPARRPLIQPNLPQDTDHFTFLLDSNNADTTFFIVNITIDGFVIDGINQKANTLIIDAQHVVIKNCEVKNAFRNGIMSAVHGKYILFDSLSVHDNGRDSFWVSHPDTINHPRDSIKIINQGNHGFYVAQPYLTISHCDVYRNAGYGIKVGTNHLDGRRESNFVTVKNNRCYRNKRKGGIAINHTDTAVLVYNNICYENFTSGIEVSYNVSNVSVYNNSLYNNAWGISIPEIMSSCPSCPIDQGVDHVYIKNNLLFKNFHKAINITQSDTAVIVYDSSNFFTNPYYVDRAAGDFRLISSSPAINKGATLAEVADDFNNTLRPIAGQYDVGAYEGGVSISVTDYRRCYYVDSAMGNDTSAGTFASPFKTIEKGLQEITGGDTLFIKNGTYIERIIPALFATSGLSWAEPVVIRNYPGHRPVIRPDIGGSSGVVHFTTMDNDHDLSAYFVLDSLIIDAVNAPISGIAVTDSAHHIKVQHCEIKNMNDSNAAGVAIYAPAGGSIELNQLYIHHHAKGAGIKINNKDVTVSDCEITQCLTGISAQNSKACKIIRNKVHHNTYKGILLITDSGDHVLNNLVWKNGSDGINMNADLSCLVYNNTSALNGANGIFLDNASGVNNVKNNIGAFNGADNIRDNFNVNTLSYNFSSGNPRFMDTTSGNFHLRPLSLCINAGTTLTETSSDFDLASRPKGFAYDMGAFEYISRNYYVHRATGSDTNQGTYNAPFASISKGVSVVQGGDTLFVLNGTYPEAVQITANGPGWNNPIAIRNYPSHFPEIKPTSVGTNGAIHFRIYSGDTAGYIELDSFLVNVDSINQSGIAFSEGAHHIKVKNCEIKNMNYINASGVLVFSSTGSGIELDRLKVHHATYEPGIKIYANNVTVSECEVYNCVTGIMAQNTSQLKIHSNKIHHNTGRGICLITDSADHVFNNVVWKNTSDGITMNGDVSCLVYNNTIALNSNNGIYLDNSNGVNNVKNNIGAFNGADNIRDNFSVNTLTYNFSTGDPKFVDTAQADFRLDSSSLAIDSGTTLSEVTTDIRGVARPQGSAYDVGAYEYSSTFGKRSITLSAENKFSGLVGQTIAAHPNPVGGQVVLKSSGLIQEGSRVIIMDMLGKIVLNETIPEDTHEYTLSIDQLRSGTFILTIGNEGSISRIKLLKP